MWSSTSMDSTATGRPISIYCDGIGCRVLCLRHDISVGQHIGQRTTATSRHHRDMTSDVKTKQTNKLFRCSPVPQSFTHSLISVILNKLFSYGGGGGCLFRLEFYFADWYMIMHTLIALKRSSESIDTSALYIFLVPDPWAVYFQC